MRHSSEMNEADYQSAVAHCLEIGFVSTGKIQRHLGVGYNAAARVVEWMEERGFCGSPDVGGRRRILQQQSK